VSYLALGLPKRVEYWSAVTEDEAGASNEVDEVAWLPVGQAMDRLSYAHDRDVVSRLVPQSTVPLIIVRHASAVPKRGVDDLRRSLDVRGQRDAGALASLLACFAPRARVLSSPALRCVQTVRPYAALAGVKIEEDPELRTDAGDTSAALIRTLVKESRPAIVCVHRENLRAVLGTACTALGASAPDSPRLPKGGFWVAHAAAGKLAALERHELR
jgi:8-oxo-(d)GTP phosphatase